MITPLPLSRVLPKPIQNYLLLIKSDCIRHVSVGNIDNGNGNAYIV